MKTLTLLTSCLAVFLSGCAFGDRNLTLKYEPNGTSKASKPHAVSIGKFDDIRGIREFGRVRNGYGMVTAKVYGDGQDAGEWVASALAAELKRAGCSVSRGGAGTVTLGGKVNEAFADVYFTVTSNVGFDLTLKRGGQVILSKHYDGKGSKTAWTASASEYEKSLVEGLQDALSRAVPDVLQVLDR